MSNVTALSSHHARRRRDRIGADQARVWARQLELRNPHAKAILLAVANYMNEDGSAWPGVTTISRDTDLAEETVRRRMVWLEQIGAIALFKRWRDENGVANYDGNGKITSSEIRFLFDADVAEIERRARGDTTSSPVHGTGLTPNRSPLPHTGLTAEASPVPGTGLNPASPPPVPQQPPTDEAPEQGEIAGAATGYEDLELANSELSNNPPYPPSGGAPLLFDDRREGRFQAFRSAYPIPLTDERRTREVFGVITDHELDDVVTGSLGYAAFLKAEADRGRPRPAKDAHRWLSNRQWTGYIAAGQHAEEVAQWRHIDEGSEQWVAWEIFYRCCGRLGFSDHQISGLEPKRRAFVPCAWPPVGRGLNPDQRTWKIAFHGTGQFAAWCRRLQELPKTAIGTPSRKDPADDRLKASLLVPTEWPPSKNNNAATGEKSDADGGTSGERH
jgi:hypothetical protein